VHGNVVLIVYLGLWWSALDCWEKKWREIRENKELFEYKLKLTKFN